MPLPRLGMGDFSQRDAFTNVNEALITLDNARRVYEPLASSKLRHQKRNEAYDESQLGQIMVGQKRRAVEATPDLPLNQATAANLKAQADILEIPIQGQAAIADAVIKKTLAQEQLRRLPGQVQQQQLADANIKATTPFLPNAVNDLDDATVDSFLRSAHDPTQSTQSADEWLASMDPAAKRETLRKIGSDRLARRGLYPDLSQAVAVAGNAGQIKPDPTTGLFQVLPPIPVSKDDLVPGRMPGTGQPSFFRPGRTGLVPVTGAQPIIPASAAGVRTKMDFDPALGQNRLAVIDENGNRVGWAGGDTPVAAVETETTIVPLQVPDPFVGLNPKTAQAQKAKLYNEGAETVKKENEQAGIQMQLAQKAQTFKQLNQSNLTGPGTGLLGLRRFDPGYVAMDAAAKFVVPKMREKGSGSTSNFDAQMFEKATIGVDKPKEANDAIADAIIAQADRERQKATYLETYLNTHRHLAGAEQAWTRYLTANPIFNPQSTTEMPQLNPAAQSWQDYFTVENQGGASSSAPEVPLATGSLPEVASDEAYSQLPPNSDFTFNGKVYHKP